MADDVKIEVRAPGARQAQRDLRGVAAAEGKVGTAGKAAGRDLKKGSDDGREAIDRLGQSVGINTSVFRSWHLAAAAGAAALIGLFKKSIDYMRQVRKEMREGYREFVQLTRVAETAALAKLRGESRAATVAWEYKTAEEFAIAPEAARQAAFEIESVLKDKIGAEPSREVGRAAFKTMAVTGASGATMGALAITAHGVGARRPEEFRAFFAKAERYAAGSRVSLEQLGQVAARFMPAAVAAGLDPDYFLAMVAAMSVRIKEPGLLGTTIQRLIAAAGKSGPGLEAFAAQMGRQLGEMSAAEIMEVQSAIMSRATAVGPQRAAQAALALGLGVEEGGLFAKAFDPTIIASLKAIRGKAAPGTWAGTIGGPYAAYGRQPATETYAAQLALRAAIHQAGQEQAVFSQLRLEAEKKVVGMMGRGEDIPDVWETMPGGKERAIRLETVKRLYDRLYGLSGAKGLSQEERREIDEALERVQARGGDYGSFGLWEGAIVRSAAVVQQYQGGTHFHTNERRDPAGRPVAPMAP